MSDTVRISLYVHREEGDAWVVSRSGLGSGVYVPKSLLEFLDSVPQPTIGAVGPVDAELPRWKAEEKGLIAAPDPGQGSLDL